MVAQHLLLRDEKPGEREPPTVWMDVEIWIDYGRKLDARMNIETRK